MTHVQTPTLDIAYEAERPAGRHARRPAARLPVRRRAPTTRSRRRWRAAGCRVHRAATCAATARPGSCRADTPRSGQQAALGRRPARPSWTRSGSSGAMLAGYDWGGRGRLHRRRALAGAGARPGHGRPATTSRTSPPPPSRAARNRNTGSGINTTCTRRAAPPGCAQDRRALLPAAVAALVADLGVRRRDLRAQRRRVRQPGLRGRGACSPTATATATPPATRRSSRSNANGGRPAITVPAIVLHGADDGVSPPGGSEDLPRFTGPCRREVVPGAGHNLPQETPEPVIAAVCGLLGVRRS